MITRDDFPAMLSTTGEKELQRFLKEFADIKEFKRFIRRFDNQPPKIMILQTYLNIHYIDFIFSCLLEIAPLTPKARQLLEMISPNQFMEAIELLELLYYVTKKLPKKSQKALWQHIASHLKKGMGLVPIAHEIQTAHRLVSGGFEVDFSDLGDNRRFDILARADGIELQIECKCIGKDIAYYFKEEDNDAIAPAVLAEFGKGLHQVEHHVVCIYPQSRSARPKDKVRPIQAAAQKLIAEGHQSVQVDDFIAHKIKMHDKPQGPNAAKEKNRISPTIEEIISASIPDFVPEAIYEIEQTIEAGSFALVLGSITSGKKGVDRVKDGIKGRVREAMKQLKGEENPVVMARLEGFSDEEITLLFQTYTEGDTTLSPVYSLTENLFKSVSTSRLAAILYNTAPQFHDTEIIHPQTKSRISKGIPPGLLLTNRGHPNSGKIEQLVFSRLLQQTN